MSRLQTYQDYARAIAGAEQMLASVEQQAAVDAAAGLPPSFAEELAAQSFRSHAARLRAELDRLDDDSLPGQEIDLVFRGRPVAGHTMDSEFMAHMLLEVQHLVRSVADSDSGRVVATGPFPAKVQDATRLHFAGSFPGSFGMRLEAVQEQPALDGFLSLAPTLRTVLDLFSAVDQPEVALARFGELGPRARGTYRTLVERIGRAEADVDVAWPGIAGTVKATIRHRAAKRLIEELRDIRVRADGRYYIGELDEASKRKGRFGFTADDGGRFDGLVEPDVSTQVREFFDRGRCRAYILTREVEQLRARKVKRSHRLQELLPLEAPADREPVHFDEAEETASE